MRYLKTNTATHVTVGPFVDVTDGVTPLLSLTPANCHLTLVVDVAGVPTLVLDTVATTSGAHDLVHITGDDAGYFDLELLNTDLNYLGRAMLSIVDDDVHLPVFHEFSIVGATWYDGMFAPFGSVVWGHVTDIEEMNSRAFASNWSGGTPSGSSDSEVLQITSGDGASESEDWLVGVRVVKIRYDYYNSGSGPAPVVKYKNTATQGELSGASWVADDGGYIYCLGWMKLRIEYP